MSNRWALFQRMDIPDFNDPTDIYLTRWRIIQTPWFGAYLHCIRRSDNDRHLHDHPWSFASVILRGGYQEERLVSDPHIEPHEISCKDRRVGSFSFRKHTSFHRIHCLYRDPTWSFVFVGRRREEWGYLVGTGWIDHETYLELK